MKFNFIHSIIGLLYPSVCAACGNSLFKWENLVCTRCRSLLPRTGYELNGDNPLARMFYGKVRLKAVTGIPVGEAFLIRSVNTATQTHKTKEERWENVRDIFEVRHPERLEGKYVLLVDDVLTTGATLEACALKLSAIPNIVISCATAACAG